MQPLSQLPRTQAGEVRTASTDVEDTLTTSGKLPPRHLLKVVHRRRNSARLAAVREKILCEIPGCPVASDQFCRQHDLAIDFREDVPPLELDVIVCIVSLMEDAGMTARISAIHVDGRFGDYDKLSMARPMMQERYDIDLDDDAERHRCVVAGDSPNDAPMFVDFPLSGGLANVLDFADRLPHPPRFITHRPSGAGFAEPTQYLMKP